MSLYVIAALSAVVLVLLAALTYGEPASGEQARYDLATLQPLATNAAATLTALPTPTYTRGSYACPNGLYYC